MAKANLSNSPTKIKKCVARFCDESAKSLGYCALHRERVKSGRRLSLPKYAHDATYDRNVKIIDAYQDGRTLADIAREVGVSRERVRQILIRRQVPKVTWEQRNRNLIERIWKRYLLGTEPRHLAEIFGVKRAIVSKCLKVRRDALTPEELSQAKATADTNRFWNQVDKKANEQECWEWQGSRLPTGYGRCRSFGRWDFAHRIAYERHYGERPTLHVLHSCDNPPCVNPHHLRQGTMAENMKDRDRRGRAAWQKDYDGWLNKLRSAQRTRQKDGGTSRKLSDDQTDSIRRRYADGESSRVLGAEFGVHFSHIVRIARGEANQYDKNGNLMPLYPPSEKVHKLFRDKFTERNGKGK